MSVAVVQELPVPDVDPDQVRGRADDIMARAEFSNSESILDRAQRWLNEVISGVFDALSSGGVGALVGWFILGALVIGVALLLWRLAPAIGSGGLQARTAAVHTSGPAATDYRTAADWRSEADRLTAEGSYELALRARYRALLADLIALGLLADVAGRTPGEYRAELADEAPSTKQRFGAATDQFEVVWYGADDATADDLTRFIQHEHAVLTAVGA